MTNINQIRSYQHQQPAIPMHNDKGEVHVMMVFHCEIQVEGDEENVSEDELDLDRMTQQVRNLFLVKFL